MDEFKGLKVPIVDLPSAVREFNNGVGLWCTIASTSVCRDIGCNECIFCCNVENPAEKIKAFGDYAIAHGHEITRPAYLALASKNVSDIASDTDEEEGDDIYTHECRHCGVEFTSEDEDADLCAICKESYDYGHICQCDGCGDYYNPNDEGCCTYDTHEYRCGDCMGDLYNCEDCGDYYEHLNNVHTDDNDRCICDSCWDNGYYYHCEDCGDILDEGEVCWHDDNPYCESCCPTDVINDYSYKPEPWFSSTNKDDDEGDVIYLGFELEAGDASRSSRDDVAEQIDEMTDLCYLKEDCSIPSYGFEMVSHPSTYRFHLLESPWEEILDKMRDAGLKSHDASKPCGLHVHVNRKALTPNRWVIVDWFIHKYQEKWEEIARRKSNHFAEFKAKNPSQHVKDVYGKGWGRYCAINFSNRSTVEFRLFRGTLIYSTFIGTLCLVDAVVRWARQVRVHDILCSGAWDDFITYIREDARYEKGVAYLKSRNIID